LLILIHYDTKIKKHKELIT